MILALAAAAILYAMPVSVFLVEPEGVDLSLTDGLPASRANVLLLGMDELRDSSQRSDAMVIASVGYGKLKLTSVLRDTYVDIPGHGSGKLNSAYAYGGPELVMKTLNESFDLNIMHYVAVDFVALAQVVDAIGGVEIDITEAEMNHINENMNKAMRVFQPLGYVAEQLTRYGDGTRLNGLQALGYARIRKLDSDFRRADRQRTLLGAMVKRIRGNLWNPLMLVRLARALTRSVQSNMSMVQLLSMGEKALAAGAPEQLRLPVDGSYEEVKYNLRINDRQANIDAFRAFVYD